MKAYVPTTILGSPLCTADSVKDLRVRFDSDFSLSKHVKNACKSCFVQFVVSALVSNRLDYCNSPFRSFFKFNIRKLQYTQNNAARIVSNTSRYTSITPVLKKLHWLPVEHP